MENILVYIAAAVLPAAALMLYVYKKDTVEKESWGLLFKLIIGGCLSAVLSGILEGFAQAGLNSVLAPNHPAYTVLLAFLVVAVVEEGTKFFFLRRRSWKSSEFNYCFDGMVYAIFVSLGFAALENIGYVLGYGLEVAPTRALFAIPAHLSFAVYMGYFYGRAKRWDIRGMKSMARKDQLIGYLIAVFLHGFYDTCALTGTTTATIIFFIFVVAVDISVIFMIKHGSKEDEPL